MLVLFHYCQWLLTHVFATKKGTIPLSKYQTIKIDRFRQTDNLELLCHCHLLFTDCLQSLPPVITIGSNTKMCNDLPGR